MGSIAAWDGCGFVGRRKTTPPSSVSWKRPFASHPFASALLLAVEHWHFVLWPEKDGDLSRFVECMANMHTQRWQRAELRVGYGHLYQGRFKSFAIDSDEHCYAVAPYAERNALFAGLVERAQDCPWGSLYRRVRGGGGLSLGDWPLPHPRDWARYVNAPQTEAELEAIRRCVRRGSP